jgi:hypothetical protein
LEEAVLQWSIQGVFLFKNKQVIEQRVRCRAINEGALLTRTRMVPVDRIT